MRKVKNRRCGPARFREMQNEPAGICCRRDLLLCQPIQFSYDQSPRWVGARVPVFPVNNSFSSRVDVIHSGSTPSVSLLRMQSGNTGIEVCVAFAIVQWHRLPFAWIGDLMSPSGISCSPAFWDHYSIESGVCQHKTYPKL